MAAQVPDVCTALAGRKFLVVGASAGPLAPAGLRRRIDDAVEGELAARGALPAAIGVDAELTSCIRDQVFRTRALGTTGLAIALPPLSELTDDLGRLNVDDSAALLAWTRATAELPVVLLASEADRNVAAYAPMPLERLLASEGRPAAPPPPPVVDEATWIEASREPPSDPFDMTPPPAAVSSRDMRGQVVREDLRARTIPPVPNGNRRTPMPPAVAPRAMVDEAPVIFAAETNGVGRANETGGRATEMGGRSGEINGRAAETGGRATEMSGRAAETGGRATEMGGRAAEIGGAMRAMETGGRANETGGRAAKVSLPDGAIEEIAAQKLKPGILKGTKQRRMEAALAEMSEGPQRMDDGALEATRELYGRDSAQAFQRDSGQAFLRGMSQAALREAALREATQAHPRDGGPAFQRDAAQHSRDGGQAFQRDGGQSFEREPAQAFQRDGAQSFEREPAQAFQRDGAQAFQREAGRDGAQAYARGNRPEEGGGETATIVARARDAGAARAVNASEWRNQAVELDAARGPKPVRVIEQLFMTRYVPLVGALARGEADGAVRSIVDGWAQAFEHSYMDAFSAMRVTGKRPMMTFDAPEIATRIARLNGARTVKLLLVDAMSYDLGERVSAELRARATANGVCVDRMLLWSALPTTTPMQMALLARGPEALRDVEPPSEPEPEIARGRAVATLRRERLGTREVMKLDLVEARLRTAGPGYEERLDAIADEVATVLSRFLESLPPRTLLFVFGDHGFKLPKADAGRTTGPATQGGASPEEVLVPAYAWLSGGVH